MTPGTPSSTPRAARLLRLLPSRADYRGLAGSWRVDLLSGLTVGIVALPLALAFGVSSGAGAEAGLITAVVAGLIAAVFGGSHVQVSGPTGAMVVVLAPIVAAHGASAVALVSLMAGLMVLLAGVLGLGRAVGFIPWPVIEGFTAGIGIIIFLQQVPSALGVPAAGHDASAVIATAQSLAEAEWPQALLPLGIAAAVAGIIVLLARLLPSWPGSFIAIVLVSVLSVILALPLTRIGALPSTLPVPSLPVMDTAQVTALLGPAAAVAALAAIESLLSARVASTMSDRGVYDADRELLGQGLASIGSGLFGGMPATGAIARTAVNVRSGARTRVSAIVHALILLVFIGAASGIVAQIPLAALSGVLMYTAARMVSPAVVRRTMGASRQDALVFLLTAAITVSFDLIVAVGIGVAVAAFFALRQLSQSAGVHREEIAGEVYPGDERIAVFRVEGALFFGAAERIIERVNEHRGLDVVILRLSQLQLVDATGANSLAELVTGLERRGITVLIKGVREEHSALLERLNVIGSLRHANHLFTDLPAAVAHARSHIARLDATG